MMGTGGSVNCLAVDPDLLEAGYGKILIVEAEQLLLSVDCPKFTFCVRTDNNNVVEFYRQLGCAVEPVHLLGKRLIKGD